MNSRAIKITVSLLLTVSLLCCSVSVFADDEELPVVVDDGEIPPELIVVTGDPAKDSYIYYIWYTLRAWGINFSLNQIEEYTNTVGEFLWEQLLDWISTIPSVSSFNYLASKWQAIFNQYGIFYGNQNFLQDIQDFAEWMVLKFALASDTTHVITQGLPYVTADNGVNYYAAPYDSQFINLGTPLVILNRDIYSEDVIYFENGRIKFEGICYPPGYNNYTYGSIRFRTSLLNNNGGYTQQHVASGNWSNSEVDQEIARLFYFPGGQDRNGVTRDQGIYLLTEQRYDGEDEYGQPWYYWAVNITTYSMDGEFSIVVGDLDVPDSLDGESIEIDDTTPYYPEMEWPETISVDNLPAIISTGTLENPEIDQIYTNIPAFIETAGETMNAFKQIIYRMPDEVLICLYAVLSVGVIFGFLRIMREH